MWNFHGVWEALLDAIVPPRARTVRVRERTLEEIPLFPTEHELLGTLITTLMDYRENAVQDLVRALKYDGSSYAAALAGAVLAEYLREEIASVRLFSQKKILIAPLPLHKSRTRERGFNQVALVLERLPPELKNGELAALAPHCLARIKATKPQTRLPRAKRLRNVEGAFAADASEVRGTHVFLVDDVATTGATLMHAGLALEKSGAEVSLLALARA